MNWDSVLIALITGLPATLAALGALLVTIKKLWTIDEKLDQNTKLTKETGTNLVETIGAHDSALRETEDKAKKEAALIASKIAATAAVKTDQNVKELAKALNGRMDQQIETVKTAAYAEGLLAGKKDAEVHASRLADLEEGMGRMKHRLVTIEETMNTRLQQIQESLAEIAKK